MATTALTFDLAHSEVAFQVRHMMLAKVNGRFTSWNGSLQWDEAQLANSSVQVEIDASSINTGIGDRDAHLRSPDFFGTEQFPQLRFQSHRVVPGAGDRFQIVGALTIKDVTREVTLDAEFGGIGKDPWGNTKVGFSASTVINRKDFGLHWNQVLEAGGVLVGEKVTISIEVQAVKA